MRAPVAADGDRWRLREAEQRGEAAAECIGVGLGQRRSDDAAYVIFAQDGRVETDGSCFRVDPCIGEWRGGKSGRLSGGRARRLAPSYGAMTKWGYRSQPAGRPSAVNGRERQIGDHFAQLLAGGDVSQCPTSPICCEVEQGQALGEQLAVDDALAEAGDDAEADAAGQLVERGADAAQVVRLDMLEAVPQHDPVDALAGRSWRAGCGCSRSARHRSSAW